MKRIFRLNLGAIQAIQVRNRKGQFAGTLQVIPTILVLAFLGIGTVQAYSARTVQVKDGESITVECKAQSEPILATPEPTKKPEPTKEAKKEPKPDELAGIERHTKAYKGLWRRDLLNYARKSCGRAEKVRVLVAISTAETAQGTRARFNNNWWNWGMKDYPNVQTAIDSVCKGLNGTYNGMIANGRVNQKLATCYVSGCKSKAVPETWVQNVMWSYNKQK